MKQCPPPQERVAFRFAILAAATLVSAAACVDDDSPAAPNLAPGFTVSTLPIDSLVGDPPFLAVAGELPSFAGFYFNDQDQVVVALTDVGDLAEAETLIRPHLGSHQPTGGFVARAVDYPFLELARYRTLLRGQVFEIDGVVALGVNESENQVKVGVTDLAAEPEVKILLATLGVPGDAVLFQQMPRPTEASHQLTSTHPSGLIEAGWQIATVASIDPRLDRPCTLGFSAVRASDAREVFVTNSHCTTAEHSYDGDTIWQPWTTTGTAIGRELLDPEPHTCGYPGFEDDCRHADAALIDALVSINLGRIARTTERCGNEDCFADLTIDHLNPTLEITGRNDNVFENEILDKVGVKTGWTFGAVEDTCDDVEMDGWVRQCSDRVDFSIDDHDSGGPVFYLKSDGTIELRGIVFGDIPWPYADAWMSDLNQIENDLGSLIVWDLPVSATISGPAAVPPNETCEWSASVIPGLPPYTYEWHRDGFVVSTAWNYVDDSGTTDFRLELMVTDGRNETDTDVVFVDVDAGHQASECGA